MKKLSLAISALLLCCSVHTKAQTTQPASSSKGSETGSFESFQSGSLIVSAAWGIDGYSLKQHQVNNYTGKTYDTNTGAASRNFNIGAEYGVTKWLGLGLQFKFDNYYHDYNIQSALGFELGIIANAHIIRHRHFDLLAGINVGGSNLTITGNYNNDQIYGSGTWFDMHLTARIYIRRFGFSSTIYIPYINYSTLTSNVGAFNQYILESWKANGVGINFGIQYHFLK